MLIKPIEVVPAKIQRETFNPNERAHRKEVVQNPIQKEAYP